MWGLDDADPRVAIAAMQAMNASVRNAVFFPSFFLTPIVLGGTALLARASGNRRASSFFAAGAVVYLFGGLILTATVNVPMNEDLATVVVPDSATAAADIWDDYSGRWQVYNIIIGPTGVDRR
ncbi:MAG: anthrone oxygenase family protein [Actinomycetota bacterium]